MKKLFWKYCRVCEYRDTHTQECTKINDNNSRLFVDNCLEEWYALWSGTSCEMVEVFKQKCPHSKKLQLIIKLQQL